MPISRGPRAFGAGPGPATGAPSRAVDGLDQGSEADWNGVGAGKGSVIGGGRVIIASATPPAERSAVALVYWSSNASPTGRRSLASVVVTLSSVAGACETIHSVSAISTIAATPSTQTSIA